MCSSIGVRVRITRVCRDEIDGVPLARFQRGLVYEVDTSLGCYLVASGCAEVVLDGEMLREEEEQHQRRINVSRWRDLSAEVTRRQQRRGGP
jgi:hypothetical protein